MFILNEKLILCEDDVPVNVTQELTKINIITSEIENVTSKIDTNISILLPLANNSNKFSSDILDRLLDVSKQLDQNQTWNNKEEIIKLISEYAKEEINLISKVKDIYTQSQTSVNINFNNLLVKLNELNSSINKIKADFQNKNSSQLLNKLKSDYIAIKDEIDKNNINSVINTLLKDKKIQDLIININKLKTKLNQNLSKFKNLFKSREVQNLELSNEDIKTIFSGYEHQELEKVKNDLTIEFKKYSTTNSASSTQNIETELSNILKSFDQINTIVENGNTQLEAVVNEASELEKANKNTPEQKDWKNIFKNATESGKNLDELWNNYYKSEWPAKIYNKNQNDLRGFFGNIGEPFTKELLTLGFHKNENPFIAFLQIMLKNNTFFNAINKNPVIYSYIHNAYIDDLLVDKDLYGTGTLGKENIIFKEQLYNYSLADIQYYLTQQAIIESIYAHNYTDPFKNYSKNAGEQSNATSILNIKYGKGQIIKFITDLFYPNGNVLYPTLKRIEGNSKNNFYSTSTINKAMQLCFDKTTLHKAEADLRKEDVVKNEKISKNIFNTMLKDLKSRTLDKKALKSEFINLQWALIAGNKKMSDTQKTTLYTNYNITNNNSYLNNKQNINPVNILTSKFRNYTKEKINQLFMLEETPLKVYLDLIKQYVTKL